MQTVTFFRSRESAQEVADRLQADDAAWTYQVTCKHGHWVIAVFDEAGEPLEYL